MAAQEPQPITFLLQQWKSSDPSPPHTVELPKSITKRIAEI